LLDEVALGQSGLVDATTAARGGRLLGAGRVVRGQVSGSEARLRLEAAVVRVGAAGQPGTVSQEDAGARLFEMEKALAFQIYEEMGVSLTQAERERVGRRYTENLQALLGLAGWRLAAVDVVMNKMCFIDQAASAATYLASMDALAASYPATVFVYTTMPLTVDEDADNVLRNLYNRAVRLHCAASGALLYDLADMEAHDPAGGEHTFLSGGQTYQKLYAGYTSDGGHLDTDLGHRRLAQGWYAAAATLAPCRAFADGFESGDTGRWSVAVP